MKPLVSLSAILCLASSAQLTAYSQILNPANNHYYYLLGRGSWTACQAQAVTLGGNLVTINDAAENAWVYETFGGVDKPLWIGLTDQATEGTFAWISGEPLTYSNWSAGEPNNNQDEDYAYIVQANPDLPLTPGKWNDFPNDYYGGLYGVVEVTVVPEPAGLALIAFGSLALVVWRWRAQAAKSS